MPGQTNNLSKLIVLFWRHSTEDKENSRTTDFHRELIYNDKLRLRHQHRTEFIWANVNRRTESYRANKDVVERYRRYKVKRYPLVICDLRFPNERGSREEKFVIERDSDVKAVVQRIHYWIHDFVVQ